MSADPLPGPLAKELPESPIRRTPTILQLESVECGAAALSMVLAYHGRHVPLEQMRVDCGVSRDGSKASGLLRAARAHGLAARGFRKEPRELAEMPMPAIVFVNFNHFVVLEGFRQGRAYLNDPARGRRSVDAAEFDQAFTGVVLTFERGPEFVPGGEAPSVLRSLAQYLEGFRGAIAAALVVGLLLVIPGLVMPYLLGRFVDEVLVAHLPGIAWPLLAGLGIAALVRSVLLAFQARLLMDTFGRAARVAARRFFAQALALPMTFYSQRSAGEIAARVDLNERVAETISHDLAHSCSICSPRASSSSSWCAWTRASRWWWPFAWRSSSSPGTAWRGARARSRRSCRCRRASSPAWPPAGSPTSRASRPAARRPALFRKWVGLQIQFVNATDSRRSAMTRWLGEVPSLLGLIGQLAVLGIGSWLIMGGGGFSVGDLVAFQVLLAGFTAPVHALFARTQKLQTLRGDLARLDDVLHHAARAGAQLRGQTTWNPRIIWGQTHSALTGLTPNIPRFQVVCPQGSRAPSNSATSPSATPRAMRR